MTRGNDQGKARVLGEERVADEVIMAMVAEAMMHDGSGCDGDGGGDGSGGRVAEAVNFIAPSTTSASIKMYIFYQ